VFTDSVVVYPKIYPFGSLPSYSLVSCNVNWERIANTPADLEFFMTNALNRYYNSSLQNLNFSQTEGVGEPRMFGVRLRYHFGG
jgi:iron complex outermembrane receptor protein